MSLLGIHKVDSWLILDGGVTWRQLMDGCLRVIVVIVAGMGTGDEEWWMIVTCSGVDDSKLLNSKLSLTPYHIWHVSPYSADRTICRPRLGRPARRQAFFTVVLGNVCSWSYRGTPTLQLPHVPPGPVGCWGGTGGLFRISACHGSES